MGNMENMLEKTRSMEVLMGKILYECVMFHCHVYRGVNLCLDNHCNEGPIFDLRRGIAINPQQMSTNWEGILFTIGWRSYITCNDNIYIYYRYWQIITTSLFSLIGIMVSKRNHPRMAQQLRLVKYFNLPRLMEIYICVNIYIYMYVYVKHMSYSWQLA